MTALPWESLSDQRVPGDYPLEELPEGWANAKVTFSRRSGRTETRVEIIDRNNGTRYLQEPMKMIAYKCAGLFALFLPAYFLIYTFCHLIRTPIVTLVNLSPKAFLQQIWILVRIPFYAVALEFAALYGIFKPIEGRALFGKYEADLHGKTRRDAEQHQKVSSNLWEILSVAEPKTVFFIGYCMAPIGQTDDPHILNVEFLLHPVPPAV